jgi:hypothetical protein
LDRHVDPAPGHHDHALPELEGAIRSWRTGHPDSWRERPYRYTRNKAMNDMRGVIVPKSDQINADDLLAGPLTITIREVTIRSTPEQPVSIFFENDGGKPWKPCKSMSRVLVAAWGPDAKKYIGRSATLYCDPKVKWGGMEVGGIRVSHLSHIDRDMVMALTATKGKRAPFTVRPLVKAAGAATGRPVAELADEAAHRGVDTFREFWKSLNKADRTALQANLANYQTVAKTADDERATRKQDDPPEDPFADQNAGVETKAEPEQSAPETAATIIPAVTHIPCPEIDGAKHWRGWADAAKNAIPLLGAAQVPAWREAHSAELAGLAAASKKLAGEVEAALTAKAKEAA